MSLLFFLVCCFLSWTVPVLWMYRRAKSYERAFSSGRPLRIPAEVAWRPLVGPAERDQDQDPDPDQDPDREQDREQGQGRDRDRPVRGDFWLIRGAGTPPRFVAEDSAVLAIPRGGRVRDIGPRPSGGLRRSPSPFVQQDVVVYEVPRTGRLLEIAVPPAASSTVSEALTAPGADEPAREISADDLRIPLRHRIRVPGFVALLLAGVLALGLFGAHTFGLGREVTATVTGARDGECRVQWQDPWDADRTRRAQVDCYQGEKRGDTLRISARPWPVRGEAADLEDSPFMTVFAMTVMGTAGLIGIVAASVGDARRLRRLRKLLLDGEGTPRTAPSGLVVPWWSWPAAALGLLGLGLAAFAYGFGHTVRAEVTGTAEYGCAVAWVDPWDGTRRTAEVDCEHAVRGDALTISALPWPLRGEAFDRDFTPVALGFVTVCGIGTALLGVALRSRRSRHAGQLIPAPTPAGPATPASVPAGMPAESPAPASAPATDDAAAPASAIDDAPAPADAPAPEPCTVTLQSAATATATATAPEPSADPLDRAHLAAVSRMLLARGAPKPGTKRRRPEPDPRTGRWWRSPALRRVVLASGIAWGALLVLAVTAGLSARWWVTAARLHAGPTETAVATVEQRYDGLPTEPWLLPGEAEVRFVTADGRRIVTDIVLGDDGPDEGGTTTVAYSVADPAMAEIPGDPGLTRGLWISAAVALLAIGRLAWSAAVTRRMLRRVLRAARSPQVRGLDYILLPDGEEPFSEAPALVLFEPYADRPLGLMDVEPGALSLPPQGTAEVRSTVDDPAAAVAFVDGRPVWPTSPLSDLSGEGEREAFAEYVADLVPPGVTLDLHETDHRKEG
ncbi:hypothetical protein [Streptomyces sp. NPDC052042]|uniref:hypothetical protein n=1 Tax=Streptomyces sp. NPDC052042 TaxID=3365683 RepID=UPI0037D0DB78